MDYYTKSVNRKTLRDLSVLFRYLFGVNNTDRFPVLYALEKIGIVFEGTKVSILNDNELPSNIPARCYPDENGDFTIEIKNSVYLGAMKKEIGAYNGFICHEMCHIFLYKLGYTPIFNRQFDNNKIPAYCSVEWQTKALCGEVMMPYDETAKLNVKQIIDKYGVSKGFALTRKKY